jgi:hypothetical protein
MSDITNQQINPQDLIRKLPNPALRLTALGLAVVCLFIPVASVTSLGVSKSIGLTSGFAAGGLAWLLPLAFIAAIAAPVIDATRRYAKLVDWAVVLICAGIALMSLLAIWTGQKEIADMQSAVGMLSGSRRNMPAFVSISPGVGLFTLLGLLALSTFTAWRAKV